MCENAYSRLVQDPEEQNSELIDLNHAPSFKNLPPAYLVIAQYDVLRDEGEYFAARLFKNNVPVSFLFTVFHAWSEMACYTSAAAFFLAAQCENGMHLGSTVGSKLGSSAKLEYAQRCKSQLSARKAED